MIPWWSLVITGIFAILIGVVAGFFITRKMIQKQLEKNPIISESAIKAMFQQMGRKPSETQVKQVMNAMKKQNKKR